MANYKHLFIQPYFENGFRLSNWKLLFVNESDNGELKIYNQESIDFLEKSRIFKTKNFKWKYVEYVKEQGIVREVEEKKLEIFMKVL